MVVSSNAIRVFEEVVKVRIQAQVFVRGVNSRQPWLGLIMGHMYGIYNKGDLVLMKLLIFPLEFLKLISSC